MSIPFKSVHLIINPASGQDAPILNALNEVFQKYKVNWQVSVTNNVGDGVRLTQEALAGGADLIAGYGGDGLLHEIVNGLKDSQVPLAVIPGGTGNGVAKDLNIPLDVEEAAELICQGHQIREIDLGQVGEERFLLHILTGVTEEQMADRELKNSLSGFAYILSALRVMGKPQIAQYKLNVDGQEIHGEGIICVLTNAIGLGVDMPTSVDIDMADGLLDVLLVKPEALSIGNMLLGLNDLSTLLTRWHGREITMEADPPQILWIDGDAAGQTPVTARVLPKALRVIVPQNEEGHN